MEPLIIILILAMALIILYQYRHIFSLFRYRRALESVEKRVDKPSKARVEGICPVCGDVMEEGYLFSPSGIYWSRDVPPLISSGLSPFSLRPGGFRALIGSEPLTSTPNFPFTDKAPALTAYRCRKCGIIRVSMGSQDTGIM